MVVYGDYRQCRAFMLVYDITNRNSFENIEKWRSTIEKNIGSSNCKFVLVGNKVDQEQIRAVAKQEGQQYAAEHNMQFYELSAMNDDFEDPFRTLAGLHLKAKEELRQEGAQITTRKEKKDKSQNACCSIY